MIRADSQFEITRVPYQPIIRTVLDKDAELSSQ